MKAGKDYGIHNAGYYTIRHLRIEKLFAYWGTDMGPTTTPFESGREFRVNLQVNLGRSHILSKISLAKITCYAVYFFQFT